MITVVAYAYIAGVSTIRMDKLLKAHGIHSLSKPQVCRIATYLDEYVLEFRTRLLHEAGRSRLSRVTR